MRTKTSIGAAIIIIALFAIEAIAAEPISLKTRKDRENYTTGVTIVRILKQQGGEINLDIVIKGMMDELTGYQLLMTEDDIRQAAASIRAESTEQRTQAAMKHGEMKAVIEGAAPADDGSPAAPQDQRQEKTDEQINRGGVLAASGSAGMNATALNNSSGSGQGQASPEQQIALAPNGSVLSRRNQAKLTIKELKAEMRAKVASGE